MYGSLHIWRSGQDLRIRNLCHNINSDFSDPAYMMDTEQFKELTEGLIRLQTEKVTPDNRREEELPRYHLLSKADELMQPLEMALCHHWPTG